MSSKQQYFDPDFEPNSEISDDLRKLFRRNKCIGEICLICEDGRRIPLWLIRELTGVTKNLHNVFLIEPIQ